MCIRDSPSSSWEISAYDGNGKYIGVSASHMEGFRPGFGYYTNDRTNTGHDSNHNATGYIEHSWNEGNGFSDTTRSDIVYNDRNSTYSYNDSFSKNGGDAASVVVHSTAYNDLGLETSKNMTVSWGNSHYGLVSGSVSYTHLSTPRRRSREPQPTMQTRYATSRK